MTPDEHAAEAEAILANFKDHDLEDPEGRAKAAVGFQAAQVHAILSLRPGPPVPAPRTVPNISRPILRPPTDRTPGSGSE